MNVPMETGPDRENVPTGIGPDKKAMPPRQRPSNGKAGGRQ